MGSVKKAVDKIVAKAKGKMDSESKELMDALKELEEKVEQIEIKVR